MATQLQLRRGTTAENNAFTGAVGEVTVDTDTNALRVHDGSTTGGFMVDTVVAFQAPTAGNNYTWYRKYASGWVEQGGRATVNNNGTNDVFTMPIEMADTNYTIVSGKGEGDTAAVGLNVQPYTTTQFKAGVAYPTNLTRTFGWVVYGMAA